MNDILNITQLKEELEAFCVDRNWQKLHTPKNLAMAAAVESSELLEIFQWKTETESYNLDEHLKQCVADEISDVICYLVRICGILNINLAKSITEKIRKNAVKYPVAVLD